MTPDLLAELEEVVFVAFLDEDAVLLETDEEARAFVGVRRDVHDAMRLVIDRLMQGLGDNSEDDFAITPLGPLSNGGLLWLVEGDRAGSGIVEATRLDGEPLSQAMIDWLRRTWTDESASA
ncbi:hypothetical protein [Deinococcus yavapaiensis]|uniref:Uncharacterized protein n=1 Tax=Deinococcus yavapaiensis KR-236 TaxID=694435 RepID=A0A318SDR3_9DEIO|nr:hypothetical protein [Deinococcus yavapaiensis]PYE50548.1 hypothetical protein DES52_11766 [Deinococcus yavapaiensis KR-236]